MPLAYLRARESGVSTTLVLLILLAHHAASVFHVFVAPLPTVDKDSVTFDEFGRIYAETGGGRLSYMLYVRMLGVLYDMFGHSQYLGCQLSQVSFAISLILVIEIGGLLKLSKQNLNWVLLIYGLLPSCILTTAVTMREAFQITGFLFLVYGLLLLRLKPSTSGFLTMCLGALWLLFFHKGFAIFLLFAFPLGFIWATGAKLERFLAALAIGFVVLFLFGSTLWTMMLEQSHSLQRIAEGEGLEYVDNYAKQVERGRTDFGIFLDLSSLSSFIKTGPVVFLYYLFSPLPWQLRAALDIEGLGESLLRMFLLFSALRGVKSFRGEEKSTQGFLIVLFLFMEVTWAAGTSNWGTAIRHRLVAWPLLVLLGVRGFQSSTDDSVSTTPDKPKSRRQQIREMRRRRTLSANSSSS